MAGGFDTTPLGVKPPRLARAILTMLASPGERVAMLGDLEEEFAERQRIAGNEAKTWYWRQAANSTPHLLIRRLQSVAFRRLGIVALAALGALVLVHYWDVFIARNAARSAYSLSANSSVLFARGIYFSVQMLGIALAGGAVALLTFHLNDSFWRNVRRRLAPTAIVLCTPTLLAMLDPADNYALSIRLLWFALALPSFICGAATVVWIRNRSS